MPPVSLPPFPDTNEVIDDLLDRLESFIEEGEAGFEQLQEFIEQLRADFFN
jgi:hypothetical protein